MANVIITSPAEYYPNPDIDRPLFSGSMFIGEPDTDPTIVANQKQVQALQENGSFVNVSQPIEISSGGVPVDGSGNPYIRLVVDGNYSQLIKDKNGSQKYYIPNAFTGAPLTSTSDDVVLSANTVADMKSRELQSGQYIETKGYWSIGQGGAVYLILTAIEYGSTPDGYLDIQLNNGNIAVFQGRENGVNLAQIGVVYDTDTDSVATFNSDAIETVSSRTVPIQLVWSDTVYSKRPLRINIAANWVSPVSWIGKLLPATAWDNTGGNYMVKFEAGSTEFAPTNALFGLKIFGVQLDAQNRADIEYGFYFNWLQFPEFKKIRVTNVSASANSWAVYIGAYQAKDGSANTFGQMGAMDEFDLILSSNSLKIGGVDGQGFGGGIHNAMTLTTPRCGGSANQGDGIYIAEGYANQLIGGTIEGFDVGFRNGTGHNSFHGTNIEQNSTHFVNDEGGYISGFGHQSPSWEQADKNFSSLYTLNGIMNNMFINQDQDNLLIDPRFDTNFHNNTVGGSVVPVSGNPEAVGATGKNVLEFVGGSPSSTERANFKVIPKEVGTGSGWHTLVIRARKKTSAVSASLFVQLTGATITEEYGKSAGTTGFELLEVACKQFVAGKNRTGTLTNDFRIYMCSFKVDDGANINLRILSQFGETVLDYVGLFRGTCGAVPKSLIEFDAETDISGVSPGGQVTIYDMSSKSSSATMKIQSRTIGGAGIPQRNIDYLPVDWQFGVNGNPNGIVTSYHYNYVTYGPSSASTGSTDHIFIVNSGSFRWLQRAAAHPAGTILQTKFTLDLV